MLAGADYTTFPIMVLMGIGFCYFMYFISPSPKDKYLKKNLTKQVESKPEKKEVPKKKEKPVEPKQKREVVYVYHTVSSMRKNDGFFPR